MAEKKLTTQDVTAIDKAIAAAQARKAAKGTSGDGTPKAAKEPKAPAAPREPKRPRQTDEEKAAKVAARDAERAERKTARDTARAEKLAARNANKQPAHMRKVQKAAEKLSLLNDAAQLLVNEATTNFSAAELANIALHLQHFNRVKATERALSQNIEKDMQVTVVGGDPRYIGKTGTVFKAQRIRCYVTIEGFAKPVYLFTSDVAASTPAANETTAASA